MHEYHLAESVLKSILAKTKEMPNIKKITSIRITLGNLKMVSKETFSQTFKLVAAKSICADAKLDIKEVMGDTLLIEDIEGEYE